MTITLAVLASLTFADIAHSQWRKNGDLVEDSSWQKNVGDFGTMLMVTNDAEGLFAAWNKPAPLDYDPMIFSVSAVRRGDVVMAFVVFSGCAEDQDGYCDSNVEYTAYFPDGTIYGRHTGPLWVGYPDPGKDSVELSEGNLGLRIESDDPFGTYKITADIVDNISGAEFSLSTEVTVVESN